jgi:hypothetical protein
MSSGFDQTLKAVAATRYTAHGNFVRLLASCPPARPALFDSDQEGRLEEECALAARDDAAPLGGGDLEHPLRGIVHGVVRPDPEAPEAAPDELEMCLGRLLERGQPTPGVTGWAGFSRSREHVSMERVFAARGITENAEGTP